ncbi:MAG: heavy-metal-associated domain-containing protein [Chloroflexota bacterium]|nr:heavy-metal-associated domain-containing protein [Chloroflexota bacterium]
MTITTFNVPGINGEESAQSVASAVQPTQGVSEVIVNVPARIVQVEYDPDQLTAEVLKSVIESAGFTVQRYSNGKR